MKVSLEFNEKESIDLFAALNMARASYLDYARRMERSQQFDPVISILKDKAIAVDVLIKKIWSDYGQAINDGIFDANDGQSGEAQAEANGEHLAWPDPQGAAPDRPEGT